MNWTLLWALLLAGGVIISNLMLLKYSARFSPPKREPVKPSDINPSQRFDDQTKNSPAKSAATDRAD